MADFAWLDAWSRAEPGAARLAELVSIAIRVDPWYLRSVRLELAPDLSVDAEAAIWSSPCVGSANATGFVLDPDAAAELRRRLAASGRADDAWSHRKRFHDAIPAALVTEERLRWLVLTNADPARIAEELRPALKALVTDDDDGLGVSRWACRALDELPDHVRATETGTLLAIGSEMRIPSSPSISPDRLPDAVEWLMPRSLGRRSRPIGVRIERGALQFLPADAADAGLLELPALPSPLVEVDWVPPQPVWIGTPDATAVDELRVLRRAVRDAGHVPMEEREDATGLPTRQGTEVAVMALVPAGLGDHDWKELLADPWTLVFVRHDVPREVLARLDPDRPHETFSSLHDLQVRVTDAVDSVMRRRGPVSRETIRAAAGSAIELGPGVTRIRVRSVDGRIQSLQATSTRHAFVLTPLAVLRSFDYAARDVARSFSSKLAFELDTVRGGDLASIARRTFGPSDTLLLVVAAWAHRGPTGRLWLSLTDDPREETARNGGLVAPRDIVRALSLTGCGAVIVVVHALLAPSEDAPYRHEPGLDPILTESLPSRWHVTCLVTSTDVDVLPPSREALEACTRGGVFDPRAWTDHLRKSPDLGPDLAAIEEERGGAPIVLAVDEAIAEQDQPESPPDGAPEPSSRGPRPPALMAVSAPPTTLHFVGQEEELARIDAWSRTESSSMLVLQGIGGGGKTALAWKWLQAQMEQSKWDGYFWYGFHERDAGVDLHDFMLTLLDYVAMQPPPVPSSELSVVAMGDMIHAALRERRFLLILDGVERLVRPPGGEVPSEDAQGAVDEGLPSIPASLLLRRLDDCSPSKVLVTSRLMVEKIAQSGLRAETVQMRDLDTAQAVQLLRAAGVRGDADAMATYVSAHGLGHPLILTLVAGLVNSHAPAPGDFDAWRVDPAGGGALGTLDSIPSKTLLIRRAVRGLPPHQLEILRRLASFGSGVPLEALSAVMARPDATGESQEESLTASLLELERRGFVQRDLAGTLHVHDIFYAVAWQDVVDPA